MDSEQSLQGKLILDSGKLVGSYFDRTVILICRHDESGSFGLVLNRPVRSNLGSVIDEELPESLSQTSIYLGGPVQPEALSFLKETDASPEFGILPCLALGHSLGELKEEAQSGAPFKKLRAYAGYAGWSKGQLADEMKSGSWVVHQASLALVFNATPETLWKNIMHKKGGIHRLTSMFPDHPHLN